MKLKTPMMMMVAVGAVAIVGIGLAIWSSRTRRTAVKETYEDLVSSDHVDVSVLLQGPKKTNV